MKIKIILVIVLMLSLVLVVFCKANTSNDSEVRQKSNNSVTSLAKTSVSSIKDTTATTTAETSKATTTKKTVATVPASTSLSSKKTLSSTNKDKVKAESKVIYTFPADINTVSLEQLKQIPGIGDITAYSIIEYRNKTGIIRNLNLLLEVDGIGNTMLEVLKEYLYVNDNDYAEITTTTTTTVITTTTTTTTTSATTSRTTTTTVAPQMKKVNINTASAQELSECLLIDIELAEDIVELRTNIQYFVNDLELLYVDGFSKQMLVERRPYIEL